MYAGDNADKCCNNYGRYQLEYSQNQNPQLWDSWCMGNLNWSSTGGVGGQQNTNVLLLQNGLLGSYMGRSIASFRCPADNYLSADQLKAGFPFRIRSYSMSQFFGHYSQGPTSGGDGGGPGSGTDWTYGGKRPV